MRLIPLIFLCLALLSACADGGDLGDPQGVPSDPAPGPLPTLMSDPPPPGVPPEEHHIGTGECRTFTSGTNRIDVCNRPGETTASANCQNQIAQLIFNNGSWLDGEETISVDRLGEGSAVVKLHRAKGSLWQLASAPAPCP